MDETFPDWGQSPYFSVELSHITRLHDLLTHLYVLVPVLDNDKHYWIGEDEVQKLLRHGEDWLAGHPEKEQIVDRYLKHRGHLTRQALAQLLEEDQQDADEAEEQHGQEEEQVERKISLNEQRQGAVMAALKAAGARRVLDLGCGSGNLLRGVAGRQAVRADRGDGCLAPQPGTGGREAAPGPHAADAEAAVDAVPGIAGIPRQAVGRV